MATTPSRRRRLGELLIEAGVLDDTRLKAALVDQKKWGGKLGRTLVEMGFVTEYSLVQALSKQLGLPIVEPDAVRLPDDVVQLLRVDLAERYGVFPLGADPKARTIQVASSDPTNLEAFQELGVTLGMRVIPSVASGSSIDRAIRRYYYGEQTAAAATAPAAPARSGGSIPAPLAEATLDLDELMGNGPPPAAIGAQPSGEAALRREVTLLREQVETLEKVSAGQVRALRGLVELLIGSGLISRDEYVARLRKND